MYRVVLTKQAMKDLPKLKAAKLADKAQSLLAIIEQDPYQDPPTYEKLLGKLKGYYFRRINYQHRLVYEVDEDEKKVRVLSMWTHYAF